MLAFNTSIWGAWFLLLLALVLWYKPYLCEGVTLVLANVIMGILAPMLWEQLAPYQQNRLQVFLDPSIDPRDTGYHVIQSQVAIGSGGWFGKGYLERHAEATRVSSRAAHRLHLRRGRRGARASSA